MDWSTHVRKRGLRGFLAATAGFLLAFVAISFIVGPVIVPGPLLYTLGFYVYGGLGYIVLAMAIFFIVLARERLLAIESPGRPNSWLGVLAAILVGAFYFFGRYVQRNPLLAQTQPWLYGAALHAIFLAIFVALGFTFFSWRFVKRFTSSLRRELLICAAVGVAFYAAMRVVWLSWPYLSWGVSRLVFVLLQVFPGDPRLVPPQTIIVGSFGVLIGEACSGVFSIFLFTCLFLLIVALDWSKLRPARAVFLFFVTVAGLFLVNVLRVYLIILVGYFYDPDFAVNLFHSYVGMLLFMAYFVGFLWLCYDWMLKPVKRKGGKR